MVLGAVAWTAPEGCPSQAELRARLGEVRSRVEAQVAHHDGFVLTLSIDEQRRTLRAKTCAEAADVAVFLIELSAQQQPGRAPLRLRSAPEPTPVVETTPVEPEQTLRWSVAAVAGAEWMAMPQPILRVGAAVQLDVAWLRLLVSIRTSSPLRFGSRRGPVVVFPFIDVQLGVCRLVSWGDFSFGPCIEGAVGGIRAWAPTAGPTPEEKFVAVWSAGPVARAAYLVRPGVELLGFVGVRLGAEPVYRVSGEAVVRASYAGLDTGLGLSLAW